MTASSTPPQLPLVLRIRVWLWKKRYIVWMRFRTKNTLTKEAYRHLADEGWLQALEWEDSDVLSALEKHPLEAVNDELECWTDD